MNKFSLRSVVFSTLLIVVCGVVSRSHVRAESMGGPATATDVQYRAYDYGPYAYRPYPYPYGGYTYWYPAYPYWDSNTWNTGNGYY